MIFCWGIEYYTWADDYEKDASWSVDLDEGIFLDRQLAEARVSECNEHSRQQAQASGLSWSRPMYRISKQMDLYDQKRFDRS